MFYKLLVLLCVGYFGYAKADTWRRQWQTANWEYQLIRRRVDSKLVLTSLETDTLLGCSLSCSRSHEVEAVSLYFVKETKTCHCIMAEDTSPEDPDVAEIYYGTLKRLNKKEKTEEQHERNVVWPYPKDCLALYEAGHTEDGVYTINPIGGTTTTTWCDMTNGGWTVIQRRTDGSENFTRGWSDYVYGFGNRTGEYWLGLENMHRLTQNGSHLKIYLEAFPGITPSSLTANYTTCMVSERESNYILQLAGFTGSCGDSLAFHNGHPFTTHDNDNDGHPTSNCADQYSSGWWYNICHEGNLNGRYFQAGEYSPNYLLKATGIHWKQCWQFQYSLKSTLMKIRAPTL